MHGYKVDLATVISKYYLDRLFCLLKSIKNFSSTTIHILCFDKESFDILKTINNLNIKIYSISEIYKYDKNLNKINLSRELINQIITTRPVFIKYLLKKKIKSVFLIDSDIFFYSDPAKLIKFNKNLSIAFSEHNYASDAKEKIRLYGKYNGGYVYIKSDKYGNIFLKEWIILCKKWCKFEPENNKFADQKYLENLFEKYQNHISIIKNPCVNAAPWNIKNIKFKKKRNIIYANEKKLIFFHYHGVKKLIKSIYTLGTSNYNFFLENNTKKVIYRNYINLLHKYEKFQFKYWKTENNTNINYFNILKLIKYFKLLTKKIINNDFAAA